MEAGDNSEAIIIIDDFLTKPDDLRRRALQASYPRAPNSPYPGRNSADRFELPGLTQYASRLTGDTLTPAPNTSHASFRACLEGEQGIGGVHIDPCHWSAILYLTQPEHCQNGTDFFRHRPTKTIRAPVFPGEAEQLPISWDEVRRDMLAPNCTDPAKWEKIRHIEMRYNRLVLFRPWLWHNAGPGFGHTLENARLIYVTFYNCTDEGWA